MERIIFVQNQIAMKPCEVTITTTLKNVHSTLKARINPELKAASKKDPAEDREKTLKELNSIAAKYPFCFTHKTKNNDPL